MHPRLLDANVQRSFVEDAHSTIEPTAHGVVSVERSTDAVSDSLPVLEPLSFGDLTSFDDQLALHETLGMGGMGIVQLATQHSLSRLVAVKTLRSEYERHSDALLMLREAWATGRLEHPNIVPIHDVIMTDAGSPAIVMKRIEGMSWLDLVHNHEMIKERFDAPDPIEWNLQTLRSICNAIEFAHSRAIIHRDLKPENVMVGRYGEVYVVDWGLALSLNPEPTRRLKVADSFSDLAGTPAYMAPEMVNIALGPLTRQTDIYQLGGMLFEIFAGSPPHTGKDYKAVVASIIESTPQFPHGFPPEVEAICRKAMHREPGLRYDRAREFQLAIEGYLQHRESRRLEHRALQSYAALCKALARDRSEGRARAICHAFGECQFGFRAALVAWPGNKSARAGLDRALLATIEYELDEGHVIAAAALLGEVASPPDEVAVRVRGAPRTRSEFDRRLRALEHDFDQGVEHVARRRRVFALSASGALLPALAWLLTVKPSPIGPWIFAIVAVAYILLGAVFFWWRAGTIARNALNQRARIVGIFTLGVEAACAVGGALAGSSIHRMVLVWQFVGCVVYGVSAVWMDRTTYLVSAALTGVPVVLGIFWPATLLPAVTITYIGFLGLAWWAINQRDERSIDLERAHAAWLTKGGPSDGR